MVDKNKIPVKPTHLPEADRLQHGLPENDNSSYKGNQSQNEGNEKR